MKLFLPFILVICTGLNSFSVGAPNNFHDVRGRMPAAVESRMKIEAESAYAPDCKSEWLRKWSGGAQICWEGLDGESAKVIFKVAETGRYRVGLGLNAAPDFGRFTIHLDGTVVAEDIDLYSNRVEALTLLNAGEFDLKQGNHTLTFTLVGANAKSKEIFNPQQKDLESKDDGQYRMGFDFIELAKLSTVTSIPANKPLVAMPVQAVPVSVADEKYTFAEMKAAFSKHCYGCHGAEKVKGKVNLEELTSVEEFLANIDLTRSVTEAIEFREMPPEDEPQLSDPEYARMMATLNDWIASYLQKDSKLPAVTMRRMNRYEYSNSVRDLLGLRGDLYPMPEKAIRSEIPYFVPKSGKFPESIKLGNRPLGKRQVEEPFLTGVVPYSVDLQAEHGFNNRGDELSISPILMESFLNLANSILTAPEFDRYCKKTPTLFTPPKDSTIDQQIAHANRQLELLLEPAFRSPAGDSLPRFQSFSEQLLRSGIDYRSAMKKTVAGILASPRFIYIVERQQDDAALPLDAYEIASRLSFFLWSTIPDRELLAVAKSGQLMNEAELSKQVTRMLESPKSQALSHNFARQWMRLDQLINAVPDFERFKHYYSRFGCEQFKFGLHAMAEPILLFESIMVEDRSIMLLVDSDHTWRTDSMDTWYSPINTPFQGRGEGRFETYQSVYRKKKLKTRREGGIMTTSAVLTMTSDPLRTNPINRGAWVLTVMFNQPPPPPPDVVPEIESDDAAFEAKGLTLRQRLKQHQENESCASCHSKIDPLGFAFENFDAVGRWRDKYRSGLEIDASGDLFGESDFKDVVGFKDAMLERPELFMRGFTEHLLSYALGRKIEIADRPAVDKIMERVTTDRGRFSTVVQEVVKSYPFLNKSQYQIQSSHSQHHDTEK